MQQIHNYVKRTINKISSLLFNLREHVNASMQYKIGKWNWKIYLWNLSYVISIIPTSIAR